MELSRLIITGLFLTAALAYGIFRLVYVSKGSRIRITDLVVVGILFFASGIVPSVFPHTYQYPPENLVWISETLSLVVFGLVIANGLMGFCMVMSCLEGKGIGKWLL